MDVSEQPSVVAERLEVTYQVNQDTRSLRRLVARDVDRASSTVEAVRDVSFLARPGEAVGVVGHNGSGKSTLLRAVAGLLPPTSGSVYATSQPVLLGVAAALAADLSGRRNVRLGGTALGISRRHLDEVFDELVAFAGLEDAIDRPLRTYSSGMRARLQFAIATCATPEVLLVDEALSVGDASFKRRADGRMRELMAGAGTVFLVSHSLGSITEICSRALWIHEGQLVGDGPADEIAEAYRQWSAAQ